MLFCSQWLLARSVRYRIAATCGEPETWSWTDLVAFNELRAVGLFSWRHSHWFTSHKYATTLRGGVHLDAAWLQRFRLTPTDPEDFMRRLLEAKAALEG